MKNVMSALAGAILAIGVSSAQAQGAGPAATQSPATTLPSPTSSLAASPAPAAETPATAPPSPPPTSPAVSPASAAAETPPATGHIPPPPAGKAQVVFFRTGAYVGAAVSYKVREQGIELGKLNNASYFVAVVDPGPHTFTAATENKNVLKLELDDGETQYVRGTVQMGFLVGEANLTPADQGMFELHYAHMHTTKPPKADIKKPAA